ncbi:LCP family protein [Actinomadura parmotrematis]|uniref:LCP family protein n=1 Tax=Actinomadura parmotrematis TaxID=2864039 RepID=A0ABS7FWQ9_9ACTN|nr:LCP family protein [Actinomadura parmotrematis]MBW8484865.1 LCP family protein [Actinomadura parmotrematis]
MDEPRRRRSRPHGLPAWSSIALAAVLVTGSLSAYGYYYRLQGSIEHEDTDGLIGGGRPKKLNGALNILLIGSDGRNGANARFGRGLRNKAPASDTMILLHLSPGGEQAMGISFPRDLMVPIPACTKPGGGRTPAYALQQINVAMALAGPSCTVKTIEQVSSIKIDHFVQVDFVGFEGVTKAVGGVPICLPHDVRDPQAGLYMTRGTHTVKGAQALAYVRSRHAFGDGTDTGRIKRQQKFLGSLAQQAMRGDVLANPVRLNALLNSVAKSLKTDSGLSTVKMLAILQGVRGLKASDLRFVTVPSGPWSQNRDRVALTPAAAPFFAAVRADRTVPKTAPKPTAQAGRLRVLNASGNEGQAKAAADALRTRGYTITKVGNLKTASFTRIRYGAGDRAAAEALAKVVPRATLTPTASAAPGVLDLVIGPGFTVPKDAGGGITRQAGEIRADDALC